jgi:FixJ family two-component response regulator
MISIVDDDDSVRGGTMDLIRSMGFSAEAFPCAEDFLASDQLRQTSCPIADMRMPGISGLELYNRLVRSGKFIPTILMTAFPNERDRIRALRAGVACYLAKPFKDHELLECVNSAIDSRRVG